MLGKRKRGIEREIEKKKEVKLSEFKQSHFFFFLEDKKFINDERYPVYLELEKASGVLIAEYYAWKYLANITLATQKSLSLDLHKAINHGKGLPEYREAILVDFAKTHCVAITYLKQGDYQGLFVFDSTQSGHKHLMGALQSISIDIFSVEDTLQADHYSCHVHGMVAAREVTKMHSGQYVIPDLLSFLNKHSDKIGERYYAINKLPAALLIDSQLPGFITKYSLDEKDSEFVLSRKKYRDTVKTKFSGEKNISTYLLKKGLKFANILQIQFYLKEFENLVPADILTSNIQKDFVKKAKNFLAENKSSKLNEVVSLHDFAQKFIEELVRKDIKLTR